jgi:hypothetical protein
VAGTGACGHWELCSGEPAARHGQQADVGASSVHEEAEAARACGEKRPEVEFIMSTDGRQWRLGGAVFPRAKDGEALL